jgi:hypothetical protein
VVEWSEVNLKELDKRSQVLHARLLRLETPLWKRIWHGVLTSKFGVAVASLRRSPAREGEPPHVLPHVGDATADTSTDD